MNIPVAGKGRSHEFIRYVDNEHTVHSNQVAVAPSEKASHRRTPLGDDSIFNLTKMHDLYILDIILSIMPGRQLHDRDRSPQSLVQDPLLSALQASVAEPQSFTAHKYKRPTSY